MGDGSTSNHRHGTDSNAQAQAQARTNKQNARAISHQPSRPSDESHHTPAHQRRIPPKSGYERRQFARSIAQSIVQYFLGHMPCYAALPLQQLDRSTDSTAVQFLPASCNVAAQRQTGKKKDSFTVSLSCRRPCEPGTSLHPRRNQRPSTINPNLNRPSSERPFFFSRRAIR